jgi:preprotein translocase subunit SecE
VSERAQTSGKAASKGAARLGLFARIALFFRQIIGELKKVVRPTRAELFRYIAVVLVFVAIVMAFVVLVDLGVGKLVGLVFGG